MVTFAEELIKHGGKTVRRTTQDGGRQLKHGGETVAEELIKHGGETVAEELLKHGGETVAEELLNMGVRRSQKN